MLGGLLVAWWRVLVAVVMREVGLGGKTATLDEGADETVAVVHLGDAAVDAAHLALVQVALAVDVVWDAFFEAGLQDVVEGHVHGLELDLCDV